ncbi:hypothetical protein [Nocardia arizonensis]|uniref:hypothetical protein n=1 Tax=Nocardia arizonensis TaxID=1141647 RepID=UPI0006CF9DF2|nr:hypothetical protein [Nocardia arizonensis]
MSDTDPLYGRIDRLQEALRDNDHRTENHYARIEVASDGALRAIRLTDRGRELTPDALCAEIVRLHTEVVEASSTSISAAIADIENDPRLRALTEQRTDALNSRYPDPSTPVGSDPFAAGPEPETAFARFARQTLASPEPDSRHREPTLDEEEEMDRYYQRKSWLE